jgi:DNA-directed RNA polymerase specialized sigma24 family protein
MSPGRTCRCSICRLREPLLARLKMPDAVEWYRGRTSSAFAGFPNVEELAVFIQDKNKTVAGHALADRILSSLVADLHGGAYPGLLETLFVFLYLYSLHGVFRAVSRVFSAIETEDIAQELLVCFLRVVRSRSLQGRTEYIGRVISERTNKSLFRWAIRVSKSQRELPMPLDEPGNDYVPEHDPQLLYVHFLARAIREGWLSPLEAQLLTEYEITGVSGEELGQRTGLHPKALSHRVRRSLVRLRAIIEKIRNNRGPFLPR